MTKLLHPLNLESSWSPAVHFLPLVGESYDDGLIAGIKVLVLGESHYGEEGSPEMWGKTCTQFHFSGYLEDECDVSGESQFFKKLPKILTRQLAPSQTDSAAAWRRAAYANAVQSLVPAASTSPTKEQFAAAGPGLTELAATLKPDVILMLGKRLWDGIPPDAGVWSDEPPIQAEREERRVWLVPTGPENYARATWIFHPSRTTETVDSAIAVFEAMLERAAGAPANPR